MNTITITHGWEAGHRLPHLPGKCQSLHGHSWSVDVEVTGPLNEDGIIIEFGVFKQALRHWIDTHLDHGLTLGVDDPLLLTLAAHGKVFAMGEAEHSLDLDWPTVENMARLLASVADHLLAAIDPDVTVARVTVHETPVNAASWSLT